ncbi:MAG: TIR domain-containing protein [Arcobacter sp.]|uniref:TIR domain-containing protein n=1 Tax=Arcobacter sp. TaxID=1872629 RepID=UPI003D0866F3
MEKEEALKKLQTLIENIGELQKLNYQDPNPLLDKFISRGERFLTDIFDKDNKYLSSFTSLDYFSPTFAFVTGFNDTNNKYNEDNEAYHKDLVQAQTIIESAIEDVEDWKDNIISTQVSQTTISNNIFIVHGHDDLLKTEVELLIHQIGLTPIILHKQADLGKTIIEKIEHYTDVGFGIVLYTPCDVGKAIKEPELKNRARQNVVFEHGYLIGRLGRERVCFLVKDEIETPGDIAGAIYTSVNANWRLQVVKELQAAGYNVSADKVS